MKKKMTAILLAITLLFSSFPVTALAAEDGFYEEITELPVDGEEVFSPETEEPAGLPEPEDQIPPDVEPETPEPEFVEPESP